MSTRPVMQAWSEEIPDLDAGLDGAIQALNLALLCPNSHALPMQALEGGNRSENPSPQTSTSDPSLTQAEVSSCSYQHS
jgi:hypothetical protein